MSVATIVITASVASRARTVLLRTGPAGKSSYQSYLETTSDDPVLTEEQWAASGSIPDDLLTIAPSAGVLTLNMAASSHFVVENLEEDVEVVVTNKVPGSLVLYISGSSPGVRLSFGADFVSSGGSPPMLSGAEDVLTMVCDGETQTLMMSNAVTNPASIPSADAYEPETLEYMILSGAQASVKDPLDAWIKGLKDLETAGATGVWTGASMWIFRDAYHGPGEIVYGLGGNPHPAQIDLGSGQITRNASEFIFTGIGTRARVIGTNLLPESPPLSLMLVSRDPRPYVNYGAGFGGERGHSHFMIYAGWALTDSVDQNVIYFPGTETPETTASLPAGARSVKLMTVTGQQAGSVSINSGSPVSAVAYAKPAELGADYDDVPRSADTTVAGNPAFGSPGASACSFSCLWQHDQSAHRAAIYALFKSTIGSGLGLP